MGFYDNYDFEGLKFLSKIKTSPLIATPCPEFLSAVKYFKSTTPPRSITVAEVGIGYGATALQILRSLGAEDTYYAFDFADKLKDFSDDLRARDFGIKCKVSMFGNSATEWDSYNWHLSNMIFQMRQSYQRGIFDAVYLDGAHSFFHDGLATCLLKELIKDGGILILDDVFWKFGNHDSAYKEKVLSKKLTEEQMEDMQILRVQEIFLATDPNWEKLSPPNSWRSVFRKRAGK